jgi:hypothetical protein
VVQDLRFARGLVHLDTERLLELSDLEGAVRPLAEQLDETFVEPINLLPEFLNRHRNP